MVKLPLQTPLANMWSLTIYLDDSAVSFGHAETMGFEIIPMNVSYKGNNKLGKESTGYFTFKPNRVVQAGWKMHITPPVNQGYVVSCWGLRKISLPKLPKCMTVRTSDTLALEIPEGGELQGGFEYTVGVGVTNADRLIVDRVNLWSVVIYDTVGNTQDSNHEVMGLRLGSLHVDVADRVMLQQQVRAEPGSEVKIRISITVTKDLAAGAVTELRLFPPKSFEIVELSTASLSGLPIVEPMEWDTNVLKVGIKRDAALYRGTYSWRMTVRNPPVAAFITGFDSTWQIKALQDDVTRYEHVMEGYRMNLPTVVTDAEGDTAPAETQAPSPPASSSQTLKVAAIWIVGGISGALWTC
jgi:hypothetical protein